MRKHPLTPEAALTVAVIRARGWECVKLGRRLKSPTGSAHWVTTADADEVASWFQAGYNVGLVCHERAGVAVLDPDVMLEWADMIDTLGPPSPPWVITGSGKLHYYVNWVPDCPPSSCGRTRSLGKLCAVPGSSRSSRPVPVHPDTGGEYRWITERLGFLCEPINPVPDPLPSLPDDWIIYLASYVYEH
jgi:hypothetical protein